MFAYAFDIVNHLLISNVTDLSPDTDVSVLACYYLYSSLTNFINVWFKSGTGTKNRVIPIHDMCNVLGVSWIAPFHGLIDIPAFHSLIRCVSVASFTGVRKK